AGGGGILLALALAERRDRLLQPDAEGDGRTPVQEGTRAGDIGTPLLGIVFRKRLVGNLAAARAELADQVRQLEDRDLGGISNIDRIAVVGVKQGNDAFDQVVDIAEAAGLRTVPVDGERFASERL